MNTPTKGEEPGEAKQLIDALWNRDGSAPGGGLINELAYRIGAKAMYRHLSPSIDRYPRWIKATERLPDKWNKDRYTKVLILGRHLNARLNGHRPAYGNFFQIGNMIKFDYKGGNEVDGYEGVLLEDDFYKIEWLEEQPSESPGGDKFIDYAIELEKYKRSRELSPVEREMLSLAIFTMAMKIGPPSFASFESIAKKTGCIKEYLEKAESWIAYYKNEKGL